MMYLNRITAGWLILASGLFIFWQGFLGTSWATPDRADGTFEELRLMEEKARGERNDHAVSVILYVRRTPEGDLFSVDTESRNIEVLVTLRDRRMLAKRLERRRDQQILVEYHRKVKAYAGEYIRIVNEMRKTGFRWEDVNLNLRLDQFATLAHKYPGFSSATRAQGAIFLYLGKRKEAAEALSNAIKTNPEDATAHALLGITYLVENRTESAAKVKSFVERTDSQREYLKTWEINAVKASNPTALEKWGKVEVTGPLPEKGG
jgi:tetratricopeptide (TPR) repeat protein